MTTFDAKITKIIKQTHDVKSFRFELKESVDFKAGQFFFVTIKVGGEERTKHFSFSNSPTEKGYIEFTKRITGSPYSGALDMMKPGDRAKIKMPLGSFTFEGEYEKVAFLSGGIGITPIRSMCKFAADTGIRSDMALLYSNRDEGDIIFKSDFDEIEKRRPNFRAIFTLTSPGAGARAWTGRVGRIDDKMIKEEIPDYKERVFYICGPPKMVEGMADILKSKIGLPGDKIKIENFAGY